MPRLKLNLNLKLVHMLLVLVTLWVAASDATSSTPADVKLFHNLVGHSETMMALSPLPLSTVQDMLFAYDQDLELVPQNFTAANEHPVLFMFNNMTHLKTIPVDILFGMCEQYYEFIVLIPFVKSSLSEDTRSVATTLFLNNGVATLGGNIFYGMPKQIENVSMSNVDFKASDIKSDQELVIMNYNRGSESMSYLEMKKYESFNFIASIFEQQAIQVFREGHLCYYFKFSWKKAMYSEASYEFETSDKALNGASALKVQAQSFKEDPQSMFGAIYVSADWLVSEPLQSCQ